MFSDTANTMSVHDASFLKQQIVFAVLILMISSFSSSISGNVINPALIFRCHEIQDI